MEPLRSVLENRVRNRYPPPASLKELEEVLHEECQQKVLKARKGYLHSEDLLVSESQHAATKKVPVPLQLSLPKDLDFSVQDMMGKSNQKARMNCMMEKKSSSEIVNHKTKVLQTPYGNLTTDPRMVHLTGQTMSVTCHTGTKDTRHPHPHPHPHPPRYRRPGPPPFSVDRSLRRGRMHSKS
ncbi:hypothetical protein GQR58_022287 [Nymphon striatum]|nr:hypothetical protein GQR58_022287 [Nymphon striatum]